MIVGAVLVTAMVFMLSLLPYAVERGTVAWLQQHGVNDARIDNVDLNLFSGEVALEGLKSGDGLNIRRLKFDFDWLPLWHHAVHIRFLELSESNLKLLKENGQWRVEGILPEAGELPDLEDVRSGADEQSGTNEDSDRWLFVVDDLVLDTVNVTVKSASFELSLPVKSLRFSLSGLKQQEQRVVHSFELGNTVFSGFGYSIHATGAKVAGEFTFSEWAEGVVASIKSDQISIGLQGLTINGNKDKLFVAAGNVALDGIAIRGRDYVSIESVNLNKIHIKHALKGQGTLKLASLGLSGIDVGLDDKAALSKLAMKKINLKRLQAHGFGEGDQSLSLAAAQMRAFVMPSAGHFQVRALDMDAVDINHAFNNQGALQMKHLSFDGIDADLEGPVTVASIGLKQLQSDNPKNRHQTIQLAGAALTGMAISPGKSLGIVDLQMQKADLSEPAMGQSGSKKAMGAFKHARLKGFAMNVGEPVTFDMLKVDSIQLPSHGKGSLGSIASIQADGAVFDQSGIYRLRQLKVDRMQVHLIRQKNGHLLLPKLSNDKQKDGRTISKVVQNQAGKQGRNRNRQVVIIDHAEVGTGSWIDFRDESVLPAFTTTLKIMRLNLTPLDSSGKRPGKLELRAQIGKAGTLIAQGSINPVAGSRFSADMHVVLKDGNLSRLSGYVEADFGRSVKTGQFNLDSDIRIHHNKIDAKNKMLIRKLELGGSKQADKAGKKISLAGGMSIDMALDMLRNNDGNIELKVPVSGPLGDPDINFGNIINKALLTSLSTGAMTYAALILQPYGSIILAADLARGFIEDAVTPKLTPIGFDERVVNLSPQMADYIAKIATLMEKKGLRLQVCGFGTRIEGEVVMQPVSADHPEQANAMASVGKPVLEDTQLLELAQKRSDAVMAALREHKIAAKRLFICRPQIDESNKEAQPRVELLLD
ncbi:MAG: DUF748 domain-containing protein [Mariprofundus sp.]|nr:DUF748 domain-containing protein [Mariprofundus sp.]